jgi:hypothetical protein
VLSLHPLKRKEWWCGMQELSVRGWLITGLLFDLVFGGFRLAASKTIRKSSERLYMLDARAHGAVLQLYAQATPPAQDLLHQRLG